MLDVLIVTASIYLLIATGYAAVRLGLFRREDMRLLGRLLVLFILPVLVFRAINRYDIREVFNPAFLGVYGLASALVMALGLAWGLLVRRHALDHSAFIGLGVATSNSVFVGYPIAAQLIGPAADMALALCLLVENLFVIPLSLALAETRGGLPWPRALAHSLRGLLRNPMFLAIVAGFASSLLDLHLPPVLERTTALVAGAAPLVALFMIGGVLVGQRLQGVRRDLLAVAVGKLLLHPLAVLALLSLLPPLRSPIAQAALMFAAMPLPAIYPALAQKHGLDGFCASTLVLVTVLSFVTLNGWLWALPQLLPQP